MNVRRADMWLANRAFATTAEVSSVGSAVTDLRSRICILLTLTGFLQVHVIARARTSDATIVKLEPKWYHMDVNGKHTMAIATPTRSPTRHTVERPTSQSQGRATIAGK